MDAIGLMQIRWVSWKDETILKNNGVNERTKLYHIDNNIKCGVLILSAFLKEAKGNIGAALFRYNTGGKISTESWRIEYNNKIFYYFFKIREHQLYGIPLDPIPVPVPKKLDTTKEVK
jgi:soluble lytic murein transglycosylase-like protein